MNKQQVIDRLREELATARKKRQKEPGEKWDGYISGLMVAMQLVSGSDR